MKTQIHLILTIVGVSLAAPVAGAKAGPAGGAIPLITMDDVPIHEAISQLARQVPSNIIFDPEVWAYFAGGASGDVIISPIPNVHARWTNVTAQVALDDLLKVYKLTMVSNPVTTVGRVAGQTEHIKPVAASELGDDKGKLMPLIKMDSVPLADAIQNLARQAGLNYVIDPAVNLSSAGPHGLGHYEVSVRWENLTIKQALVALLDNYGLRIVQNPGETAARITLKTEAKAETPK